MTLLKHRTILAAIVLILTTHLASGQMARLYTSESGLSNSQVNEIYQDSRGFIWITTENGLMRFDGMDFSTFRFNRDRKGSIASDLVLTIFEDSRGIYWVGTSSGLQTFDPEYNLFTDIDMCDPDIPGSDPHISAIQEVLVCGERKIAAASSGHGIYLLDPVSHVPGGKIQDKMNSAVGSHFINAMFCDSQQRMWISFEDGGISIVDMKTAEIDRSIAMPADLRATVTVNSFAEDADSGKIILGTSGHGILIYDAGSSEIRKAEDESAIACRVQCILKNNIYPIAGKTTYLIGLENGGIRLFDSESESLDTVEIPGVFFDTSNWKVHSLMEDNQGNVWAGAFQTGVMVIPKSMYGFEYTVLDKENYLHGNAPCVTSVVSDSEGNLWVGTDGDGLYRIGRDGKRRHYSSSNSSLSNNSIMSLAIDKRGTLWIATYLEGLLSWSPEHGFRKFKDSMRLNTVKISCLAYSEEEDILYVGTHGQGLAVVSLPYEKTDYIFADDDNKWISTLYLDKTGLLWVGTYNGPMYYDNRIKGLLQYNVDDFLSTRIFSFCEGSDGNMWIGTGEGLVCFNRQDMSTTAYTEADGLASNVTAGILEGADGNIWISTLNGLSRFNPRTEVFNNYYKHDGLQENEFHSRAAYMARDSKMYFGGIKGLTSFYPHIVDQRTHKVPPLYFSDLRVMNEPIDYDPLDESGNFTDKNITEATQITLPYGNRMFSIKFSVLEYTNPRKMTYSYMMEGFDSGWNTTGADSRVVTYTNIPSGKYTMKVKAYFEGNPEEYSYREIGVRILPPWYKAPWAFICYFIMAGLIVWGVYGYRAKIRQNMKEKEESEIKELKLRMFTNISHEIRTPLTLVMNPLKKIRESENDPKQKELYNLMYRNCLRILRLVNQLLDMRKVDNGQLQLHFLETDIVYFIKDIMQSFENMAVSRKIRFHLKSAEDATYLWVDQGNFDKIIFNILSNAFKYTPENGEVSISISGKQRNNGILQASVKEFMEITIWNSGSMVEEKYLERLFDRFFQTDIKDAKMGSGVGLNLAKMLVELHHGDIRAFNIDSGMAFSVRIPVGNSHLNAEEMTKPTNHKDLYTKATGPEQEDYSKSLEDISEAPLEGDAEQKQIKTKRNIVLVDDDDEMRAYLKLELKEIYNVTTCSNARDAWAAISTSIPDAVVTDLMMEGQDGAELCRKIRKNPGTNHIPVLILTSSSDEASVQRCTDCGADRFFTKPISLEILKGAIANAILTRDTIRNKYSNDINYSYAEMSLPDINDKLTEKVVNVIRANIENPDFGVEELSREVGMSRVHLNRKLKELMNISPSNLIRSIRLRQAAFLLINSKVNISEVAYRVGFSTHSYFSNSFHEYFGMTPKEFVAQYMDCKDEEKLKKIFE